MLWDTHQKYLDRISDDSSGLDNFRNSSLKMLIVDTCTHKKWLTKALLMSTHYICFHGKIRKNVNLILLLCRDMNFVIIHKFCMFV